jgi:hypothetical protein
MTASPEDRLLKEILYFLLEKVRATKAALYVADGQGFRLASHYGFGRADHLAETLLKSDVIPAFVHERREPWYCNEPQLGGKLAAYMEANACARLLTAPLYVDGRIAGFIEARDKAARELYGPEDVPWVQEVLRRLAVRVRTLSSPSATEATSGPGTTGGLGRSGSPFETTGGVDALLVSLPLSVPPRTADGRLPSGTTAAPGESKARSAPRLVLAGRPPAPELPTGHLPTALDRTLQLVHERLGAAGTGRGAPAATGPSPREIGFYKLNLETLLHLPDVDAASISVVEQAAARVWVASRRPLSEEAIAALLENVEKIFARAEAPFAFPPRPSVENVSRGVEGAPVRRAEVAAIQSSVMTVASDEVSILSLVFRQGPGAEGREGLRNVHVLVRNSLAEVRGAVRYREAYRGLVNKLVEPGLKRFGGLRTHSFNVGRMARKFAQSLQLSPVETEQLTVASILHDVGMRELNYDELATRRSLTEAESRLVREHPAVGAFLVDEIPWPYPVAPLVRHHHERWDGAGYPDGLRGGEIPFGARVIHICEAFDAMTSPASYRPVLAAPEALEIIVSKAGTQFDPELAPAFRRMVQGLAP